MQFLHEKIRSRRDELSVSREQLAQLCGLDEKLIAAMEDGREPNPGAATVVALCNSLRVDCTFFFAECSPPGKD